MKRDKVNYLQAGLAVLVAAAVLVWVLFRVTGRSGDTELYQVYYGNVSGLRFGTPVFYEGYRVGEVRDVEPDRSADRTRYRVELAVEQGWGIPSDSVAQISATGILGDVAVNIMEGESASMLTPGSEIRGVQGGDIFTAFNSLAGEAQMLADERVGPLLDLLNQRVDEFTAQLTSETPQVVSQVQTLLGSLNESAAALNGLLDSDNVQRIDSIVSNVSDASGDLRSLAASLETSRQKTDTLLTELESLVVSASPDLQRTGRELRVTMTTLGGRLDNITDQMDSASRNMNEFSRSIRRNPGRLLHSSEEPDAAEEPLN